jgi:hypothetical protein
MSHTWVALVTRSTSSAAEVGEPAGRALGPSGATSATSSASNSLVTLSKAVSGKRLESSSGGMFES